jgi:2-amino-4-hydroxy-6-hydroxymethyldihydropteridine diphosphokinase
MSRAYIGMGSNQGERFTQLKRSLEMLKRQRSITVSSVSPVYETEPVGGPPQGLFLNACCALTTTLSPVLLLRSLLEVEAALGRIRRRHWGPRTLDLDLLLYDCLVMNTPVLTLPHPRLKERLFVLAPLFDIAPNLALPGEKRTLSEIKASLPSCGVKLYKENWI